MEKKIYTLGTGTFQGNKIKAVHIKKQLIDKHKLLLNEMRMREITRKNLIAKRVIRMGLISGAFTYENNESRIKRSYKSPLIIKTSHDDIIYNDAKWKTKRIIKRKKTKKHINLKQTYLNLRKSFMSIIKSRSSSLISFITKIDEYLIKNIMYVNTNTYRHAETTANAAVRKIQRKYSLASTFFPTIKERKKALSGFFIFWRGRYKKTAKVKETSFERGTMPYSSANASLAIASQKVRTTYGIANCNINLHWTQRTISDSLRKYKKNNYIVTSKQTRGFGKRNFSQMKQPSKIFSDKTNKVKIFSYALNLQLQEEKLKSHNLRTKIMLSLKKKLKKSLLFY